MLSFRSAQQKVDDHRGKMVDEECPEKIRLIFSSSCLLITVLRPSIFIMPANSNDHKVFFLICLKNIGIINIFLFVKRVRGGPYEISVLLYSTIFYCWALHLYNYKFLRDNKKILRTSSILRPVFSIRLNGNVRSIEIQSCLIY